MNIEFQTKQAKRRAAGIRCAVPRCGRPVDKVSLYCSTHDKCNECTGHPLGRTIRKGELKSFLGPAGAFIARHSEHAGIKAALEWITKLFREAAERERSYPNDRLAAWLARMHRDAMEPERVLATMVALHLHREFDPRRYPSDRFARHQLAIRVLRLVPPRKRKSYLRTRINVQTRERLAERLNRALGVLAIRIAREVAAEHERRLQPTDRAVAGSDAPFTTQP
jgi:hypothetical protein